MVVSHGSTLISSFGGVKRLEDRVWIKVDFAVKFLFGVFVIA